MNFLTSTIGKIILGLALGGIVITYAVKKTSNPYGLPSVKIEEEPIIDPKLPAQERMAKIAERNTQNLTKTIERIETSKQFKENNEELAILHDYLKRILEESKKLNEAAVNSKNLLGYPPLKEETRKRFSEEISDILRTSALHITLSDKILNKDLFKMENKEKLEFLEKKLSEIKNNLGKLLSTNYELERIIDSYEFFRNFKKNKR